jgi:hypothetical protein
MDLLCYCYYCDKRVDVKITTKIYKYNIGDINVEYEGEIAHCLVCNEEVYIASISDTNIETAHQAYNKGLEQKGVI